MNKILTDLHPLFVLVTRPDPAGKILCDRIEHAGGMAMHFPTITFILPADEFAYNQAIKVLDQYQWLIFVSPQAVSVSAKDIHSVWPCLPSTLQFAAIGAGTARALESQGLPVNCVPNSWNSEGLLAHPAFQSVVGHNIAILQGEGGRQQLQSALISKGARVTSIIAYRRALPIIDNSRCIQALKQGKINRIVCTSFEGVKNLVTLVGADISSLLFVIPLLVMSERIKQLAQELGFQTIWVTEEASEQAIVKLLVETKDAI